MKRKPKGLKWEEYLTPEDHLQMQVMQYLKLQYPNILAVHIPNEGKRSLFERWKSKILGIKRSMPDLLIFKRIKFPLDIMTNEYYEHSGLAIEFKIKPNKPTYEQLRILGYLQEEGWDTKICYTFDEAKEIIDFYLT